MRKNEHVDFRIPITNVIFAVLVVQWLPALKSIDRRTGPIQKKRSYCSKSLTHMPQSPALVDAAGVYLMGKECKGLAWVGKVNTLEKIH